MNNLPNGWQLARLDELCDWGSGGTPRRSEPSYFGGEFPWITISDLNDGKVGKTAESLTEAGIANSAAKLVPEGTVLVALYGSIGKLGITTQPSTTNQAIACALPDLLAFDALYLFHFLRSRRHELGLLGTGVTQKNIYLGDIKTFEIPVAPRAEQTRIVAKLEELLSDLDAGMAELKAAQKKLGQYRQSLLKAAVEGALTAEWRAKNTPSETGAQLLERILQERRTRWEAKQLAKFAEQGKTPPKDWQKKYPEPVQPDSTDLPKLPEGWVWASVEQLAELVSGHTPKDAAAVSTQDGVVPWFKVGDMNQPGNEEWMSSATVRFSREIAESLGLKIMPAGTIIFPKRGGAIATNKKRKLGVDACYDLNTMGLVPVKTISDWLWTWFIGVDLGRLVDGAIIPQINNPDIAPLCVPIPPSSEQREIISVVNQQIEAVGNQANAVELSLKQSSAQRQNILRAAFAGELVPQDPNDEPASALLERIRAERAERAKQPKTRKTKPKEIATVVSQLIDVLADAGDWVPAQEAFRRCGVADGALTERIEELYAELRKLDKAGRLRVEAVTDAQGRKLYDKLKLLAG